MTSKQPASNLINVPDRFSVVETGVYRSASPTAAQVPFLATLSLRTIVSLTTEHPTKALLSYARANGVEFIHIGNTLFQPLTDWKPISDEIVKAALEIILDVRSHPVLIVDPIGIHQTGVVLGCLRVMQGWNFASALSEYRSHSGPTKHRYADETYIELFDPDLINLPPRHCLPSWAWWTEPGMDEDDEWIEADPPPKEKKKKKDKEKKEEKGEGKEEKKDKEKKKKKENGENGENGGNEAREVKSDEKSAEKGVEEETGAENSGAPVEAINGQGEA